MKVPDWSITQRRFPDIMIVMPNLETQRLSIRPFKLTDLSAVHHLFHKELGDENSSLSERAEWLEWTVLNYQQLAKLHQPPYGDRAIILKSSGDLIGACGFVPCLNTFNLLLNWDKNRYRTNPYQNTTEFGLYYAVSTQHRRRGYATETAHALIDYAFQELNLHRVVATTEYENSASIGVMRAVGMRIEINQLQEPAWLQVVGVLENIS